MDVPFFAQTVDLCGGAAAAMVLRYWGDRDVQAEDFAALVDSTRGGISTLDLVNALRREVRSRGRFAPSPRMSEGRSRTAAP